MPSPDAPEPLDATPAFLRGRAAARDARVPVGPSPAGEPGLAAPDPATLPLPSIGPRRLIVIAMAIVLVWVLVSFGRQVAEASAASARADELRAANAALRDEVVALSGELETIQGPGYIELAARAHRLGQSDEIPFALQPDAPPLGPDAPGSASVRLGADPTDRSPLDSWLDVLFGPDD